MIKKKHEDSKKQRLVSFSNFCQILNKPIGLQLWM